MKTSEANGEVLNYLVAKCEGMLEVIHDTTSGELWYYDREAGSDKHFWPTTDWSQGGPIIEREGISICNLEANSSGVEGWTAAIGELWSPQDDGLVSATPLIAAMRCYVASKLGDEVDIPEGLGEVTA
jgi:Protein of unknown function (DUF2591)